MKRLWRRAIIYDPERKIIFVASEEAFHQSDRPLNRARQGVVGATVLWEDAHLSTVLAVTRKDGQDRTAFQEWREVLTRPIKITTEFETRRLELDEFKALVRKFYQISPEEFFCTDDDDKSLRALDKRLAAAQAVEDVFDFAPVPSTADGLDLL